MAEVVKAHILIVDDSATVRNTVEKILGKSYIVSHASNGQEAWELLQSDNSIALVFTDMHMPVMNGMMLLKKIRNSECGNISKLPVIMITGHNDTEVAKKISYTMGATDFVSKPFSSMDIKSRAGSYTKLTREIATLEENITHDRLTKLFNKRGLQEVGDKAIFSSRRHQHKLSVLIIQIKDIDELASKFGNKIIQQIILLLAKNINKSLRNEDVLAHFGSGQFAVLLPVTIVFKAHIIALRIQKGVDKLVFKIADDTEKIKLAVGLSSNGSYNHDITFTQLCFQAEKAAHASAQHNNCKVIRCDDLLHKNQHSVKYKKSSSSNEEQADSTSYSDTDLTISDATSQKNYIQEIINGDFEKIPTQYIENLIKPMESFLHYAYKHTQKQYKD